MKILWLTPLFPYPPFSGGQTRAYNLIKNLAKHNEITLFSFMRPGRIQGPIEELKKYCPKIKTFPGRPIWSIRSVLLAGFSHLPFAITHFYGDGRVEQALKEELKGGQYDLVHFESFYTSPYLECVRSLPTVMGNENIEYLIYQRFADQKGFPLLKLLFFYDVWKMKNYEQGIWKLADLNLAVSETDADVIERITGKASVVIPNGVDLAGFEKLKPTGDKQSAAPVLLFVGDFRYFPNQDAIKFLINELWPLIQKKIPQAKLRLVGKNPGRLMNNFETVNVVVDSQVEDIRQAYGAADILLAPIRMASGTNIKILEAMAAGLPVVTTTIGAEGLAVKDDREVVIADKPEKFASAVVGLLADKKRRQQMGLAGQALVKQRYDWSKIVDKLEKAYSRLIHGKQN